MTFLSKLFQTLNFIYNSVYILYVGGIEVTLYVANICMLILSIDAFHSISGLL